MRSGRKRLPLNAQVASALAASSDSALDYESDVRIGKDTEVLPQIGILLQRPAPIAVEIAHLGLGLRW
jgi:hypothetical protein